LVVQIHTLDFAIQEGVVTRLLILFDVKLMKLLYAISGGNTHSLAGHGDAILSVKWSPASEHIIASGNLYE